MFLLLAKHIFAVIFIFFCLSFFAKELLGLPEMVIKILSQRKNAFIQIRVATFTAFFIHAQDGLGGGGEYVSMCMLATGEGCDGGQIFKTKNGPITQSETQTRINRQENDAFLFRKTDSFKQ